jgi:hypothetical protein
MQFPSIIPPRVADKIHGATVVKELHDSLEILHKIFQVLERIVLRARRLILAAFLPLVAPKTSLTSGLRPFDVHPWK